MSIDEHALLHLVARSPIPVAVCDFFPVLNPPLSDLDAHHHGHRAWTRRQRTLVTIAARLHHQGLVRVVEPANGRRPDLVQATSHGRAALAERAKSLP